MTSSKSESIQRKLLDHISHVWNEKDETMKIEKGYLFVIIASLIVIFLLLVVTDKIKLLGYWAMVQYVEKIWREMNRLEKKKESPLPMLVLLIIIGIGVIGLAWFILLGEWELTYEKVQKKLDGGYSFLVKRINPNVLKVPKDNTPVGVI